MSQMSKDFKGKVCDLIEVISWHLPGGTEDVSFSIPVYLQIRDLDTTYEYIFLDVAVTNFHRNL